MTLNSSTLLTVGTAYGLNQLGLYNNMWPLFVTEMHTNPGRLNCAQCDTQTTEPVLRNHAIRKTLLNLYYIKQIDSMLPCVCSIIDHRGRQNVVRTSVTHSAASRVPLFCSYHILTSSVIYY